MRSAAITWQLEWQWIAKKCKRKKGLAITLKAVLALTVYHVWIARNERIFGGTTNTEDKLIRDIKMQLLICSANHDKVCKFLDSL